VPVVTQQLEGGGERRDVDIAVGRVGRNALRMLYPVREHGERVHVAVDEQPERALVREDRA